MAIILNEGFEPCNTWVSLANRKYDEANGYILDTQALDNPGGAGYAFQVKPECWGIEPCQIL